MGECLKVVLTGDDSVGHLFDEMEPLMGRNPQELIKELTELIINQRDQYLYGSDYIDNGVKVSGSKKEPISLQTGIVVENVQTNNETYIRVATRISKIDEDKIHPVLKLAREARKQPTDQEAITFASPSRLYKEADGDSELFIHAMIEAGFLFSGDSDIPNDPCPICGWSRKSEE